MTDQQRDALQRLVTKYGGEFNPSDFAPVFDLPKGWVAGWITNDFGYHCLYVGCSPEGDVHS